MTAALILITLGAAVLAVIMNGYVLSWLWAWFIVPTFDLPQISIPVALGIALIMSMLTREGGQQQKKYSDDKVTDLLTTIVMMLLKPPLALLIGWIFKQWM